MNNQGGPISRRGFLGCAGLTTALSATLPATSKLAQALADRGTPTFGGEYSQAATANPSPSRTERRQRPMIHVCDLYRPFNDPDDHYDLATAFALLAHGELDLAGVLLENPANFNHALGQGSADQDAALKRFIASRLNPDVAAVSQLNYITGHSVPIGIGLEWPRAQPGKLTKSDLPANLGGVNLILDVLRRSPLPVAINIVGSCQDVAVAGVHAPQLFREKCAAIYLNAGTGSNEIKEKEYENGVEWNVVLNRSAYSMIFDIPCPIYWLPCIHNVRDRMAGNYGAYWSFREKDMLPYLSRPLKNYFSFMFARESGSQWLTYLQNAESNSLVEQYAWPERSMYSTAAFFHAAGKTVSRAGSLVEDTGTNKDAVYEFIPVDVHCDERGLTTWSRVGRHERGQAPRYLFHVKDRAVYDVPMTQALKTLLVGVV